MCDESGGSSVVVVCWVVRSFLRCLFAGRWITITISFVGVVDVLSVVVLLCGGLFGVCRNTMRGVLLLLLEKSFGPDGGAWRFDPFPDKRFRV